MENSEQSKVISKQVIICVIILNIILFLIWIGFCLNTKNVGKIFVENFPELLGSLMLMSGTIFGVTTIKSGIFNKGKGGTPYYPKKINSKVIDKIITSYFEKNDKMNYNEVINNISELKIKKDNTNNTKYNEFVYLLQDLDLDFMKVWNNFNYYETKVNDPNKDLEIKHNLRKYIYCRIVDNYNNEKQKKDKL